MIYERVDSHDESPHDESPHDVTFFCWDVENE